MPPKKSPSIAFLVSLLVIIAPMLKRLSPVTAFLRILRSGAQGIHHPSQGTDSVSKRRDQGKLYGAGDLLRGWVLQENLLCGWHRSHQRNPFNIILIQPPCYNSSHVEAFVTCHCALKDTKVGWAEVTMLNLAINASAYEEGKVMQGRKMNTPHGSLRNVSSFSNSNTRAKISNRRFRRIIETTPTSLL